MEPLVYTIQQVCAITRTSRTSVYEAISAAQLRAVKRGRRTLILADDLRAWIAGFPAREARKSSPPIQQQDGP